MNKTSELPDPIKKVRVAVFGTVFGGGNGVVIKTISLPASEYDQGNHYTMAEDEAVRDFECIHCTMDEHDPGAGHILGLKTETTLNATIRHWEVKADSSEVKDRQVFDLKLVSQCESNDQVYLDIQRVNRPAEDCDMMSVMVEIGTDPVTGLDSPVLHISGSSDDKLVSIFQRGEKLHLRLETGVVAQNTTVGTGHNAQTIVILEQS